MLNYYTTLKSDASPMLVDQQHIKFDLQRSRSLQINSQHSLGPSYAFNCLSSAWFTTSANSSLTLSSLNFLISRWGQVAMANWQQSDWIGSLYVIVCCLLCNSDLGMPKEVKKGLSSKCRSPLTSYQFVSGPWTNYLPSCMKICW